MSVVPLAVNRIEKAAIEWGREVRKMATVILKPIELVSFLLSNPKGETDEAEMVMRRSHQQAEMIGRPIVVH